MVAPMLIQIQTRLMQTKVWRYVGFTSAVVGLLCYALSSSFNYLFGEWNLLKIFLFVVFSFIICVVILFAKIWQHSRSLRFKAHTAFLVLAITSVYSFFFDKVVNGKPDAYSLISCAAFAITSLSLSRQTQCGFEVDLLYFFLGCLIVQLMRIELQLVIVGVGFSYSLIILRSSMDAAAVIDNEYPGGIPVPDDNSVSVVLDVDSPQLASTYSSISMMEQLRTCIKALQQENSNLIDMLMEQVKEYLEDDSELMVSDPNFEGVLRPKENSNLMINALPLETINNLQETAKLMVMAGLEKDCSDVYTSCRRECLEEFLMNKLLLGLQNLSIEDVQKMTFQDFRHKIERWIKASNVALKILFPSERRLCDRVFFGFSSIADFSFTEVCKGSSLQLLNFAHAVAIGSRSPEQLFRILDMYETMRDLIPEFDSLFCDQNSVSLRNEAITVWKRLGEAIRDIFMELENLIRQHPVKAAAIPGGGVHPITRYVMNYLRVACQSRQTLEQVFEDYGNPLKEYLKLDDSVSSSSLLSLWMDWIMELLESNLEAKSKIYRDPALCYVFLMNNGRYIVQKTKDSELEALLGDDVIQKHKEKVRQHHENYQRSSWDKVLGFLKVDNNGSVSPSEVAKSMEEKLKSFNILFDEICGVQSSWLVFDEHLREEITISLEKILLPAYGNFIRRFQSVPEHGTVDSVRYVTKDIEARLNDLFRGSSGSTVASLLFICWCLHWNKLKYLFQSSGVISPQAHQIQADSTSSPQKPAFPVVMMKQNYAETLPVLMPGDEIPKFIATACPCQPPRDERITIHVDKTAPTDFSNSNKRGAEFKQKAFAEFRTWEDKNRDETRTRRSITDNH